MTELSYIPLRMQDSLANQIEVASGSNRILVVKRCADRNFDAAHQSIQQFLEAKLPHLSVKCISSAEARRVFCPDKVWFGEEPQMGQFGWQNRVGSIPDALIVTSSEQLPPGSFAPMVNLLDHSEKMGQKGGVILITSVNPKSFISDKLRGFRGRVFLGADLESLPCSPSYNPLDDFTGDLFKSLTANETAALQKRLCKLETYSQLYLFLRSFLALKRDDVDIANTIKHVFEALKDQCPKA